MENNMDAHTTPDCNGQDEYYKNKHWQRYLCFYTSWKVSWLSFTKKNRMFLFGFTHKNLTENK